MKTFFLALLGIFGFHFSTPTPPLAPIQEAVVVPQPVIAATTTITVKKSAAKPTVKASPKPVVVQTPAPVVQVPVPQVQAPATVITTPKTQAEIDREIQLRNAAETQRIIDENNARTQALQNQKALQEGSAVTVDQQAQIERNKEKQKIIDGYYAQIAELERRDAEAFKANPRTYRYPNSNIQEQIRVIQNLIILEQNKK